MSNVGFGISNIMLFCVEFGLLDVKIMFGCFYLKMLCLDIVLCILLKLYKS